MKTKSIAIASLLLVCFFSLTSMRWSSQDTKTFAGTYDGHEDYGYNFIGLDADGSKYTMTFQEVDAKLLKAFDLKTDTLVGHKFAITYTEKTEVYTDEEGNDDEVETYTITELKKK